MAAKGFEYIAYPPAKDSPLDLHFRYGYVAVEDAEAGYDRVNALRQEDEQAADAVDQRRNAFGKAYLTALYGDGSTPGLGCMDQAEKSIYGVVGGIGNIDGFKTVLKLQNDSSDRLYSGSVAQGLEASWSACMKSAGYDYQRWPEARTKKRDRPQLLADATCRAQTNLETGLFNEESTILSALMEEHQADIDSFRAEIESCIDRAVQAASAR